MTDLEILEREFRIHTKARNVQAFAFRDDETYLVVADGVPFMCTATSDDDDFTFRSPVGDKVVFDFPSDWEICIGG